MNVVYFGFYLNQSCKSINHPCLVFSPTKSVRMNPPIRKHMVLSLANKNLHLLDYLNDKYG